VRFERFADDVVIHCVTERQAREVWDAIGCRFADIGLTLHPEKTKIVRLIHGLGSGFYIRRVAIGGGPLSGRIGFAESIYRRQAAENVLYHRVLPL
jgi:hypothetical protein